MKHRIISVLTLAVMLGTMVSVMSYADERDFQVVAPEDPGEYALDADTAALEQTRQQVWEEYREAALEDAVVQEETNSFVMKYKDAQMRYFVEVIGDKPEAGYPLYIAMHGGGEGDTPDFNDGQWEDMKYYYSDDLECGVYVAVRGVRDTWDTHFNPESYPLYDRLIRYMILTEDVDPNRVYLEGFSAGGDGVYAIGARMADCFAALNMSSGHPNGIEVVNLYRTPIQLQAGEYDDAYDRNTVTAEYGRKLDEYQQVYGGFEHRTLIHYDCGHNYNDYERVPIPVMSNAAAWLEEGDRSHEDVDSFPPDYMDQFTRDPLPKDILWDLSTRADSREVDSWYYLRAPYTTNKGIIQASWAEGANVIAIQTTGVEGEFSILLNEKMVDFSEPVTILVNEEETVLDLTPSWKTLMETTTLRGDPNYQFEAEIVIQ